MASTRFKAPTASLRNEYGTTIAPALPADADYSQKVLRAQSVAGKTGGKNFSEDFSKGLGLTAKLMKATGGGAKIASLVGSKVAMDRLNNRQKALVAKYNQSAEQLNMQNMAMENLKSQADTLQGQLDALQMAGCEYVNAINSLDGKLSAINNQIDSQKVELAKAQTAYASAKSAWDKAMNASNYPRTKAGLDKQKADLLKAKNDMYNANKQGATIQNNLDGLASDYKGTAEERNGVLDKNNQNLSQISDGLGQMDGINSEAGRQEALRQQQLQDMGAVSNQMRQTAQDGLNDIKQWKQVGDIGTQVDGWSDAVGNFADEQFYMSGGSAINQTINTLKQYGTITGEVSNMITPFIQQAITSGAQVLQNGGTPTDMAVIFMNATLGLSDWVQGAKAVGNAIEYAKSGDDFMSAVELNNSVSPFISGAGKAYQTVSVFTGTGSPLTGMVADFVGDMMQTMGGEIISDFEIAKAGGDFFGSLGSVSTSPFYAVAHGVAEFHDKVVKGIELGKADWAMKVREMRKDLKEFFSGRELVEFDKNVFVDPKVTFNPEAYTAPDDPNAPNVAERMKDPLGVSSRGGKQACPVPKKQIGSIATEYD